MFEFLMSADMKVNDADSMTRCLVDRLGVPEHPNWRMASPGSNYVAWFLRVQRSLAAAPTRLEPQSHLPGVNREDPAFTEYLESIVVFQGRHRPSKTHSTIVITREFDELVRRLVERRVAFRIAPMGKNLPFPRLWIGVTPERPSYDPSFDGGLCLEVLPMAPLQMPPETIEAPLPADLGPGDFVRVVQRGILVRDLDDALRKLSSNLDWEPRGPVEVFAEEGYRRAQMAFVRPHSASLDLLEATTWNGEAGRLLHTWGPGPCYIRISVNGLEAKAEDLRERGTRFELLADRAGVGRCIRIEPDDTQGVLFELVEHL